MPSANFPENKIKVGLTLGGGSARGWSHIGIIAVNFNGNLVGRHIDKSAHNSVEERSAHWSDKIPWLPGSGGQTRKQWCC